MIKSLFHHACKHSRASIRSSLRRFLSGVMSIFASAAPQVPCKKRVVPLALDHEPEGVSVLIALLRSSPKRSGWIFIASKITAFSVGKRKIYPQGLISLTSRLTPIYTGTIRGHPEEAYISYRHVPLAGVHLTGQTLQDPRPIN